MDDFSRCVELDRRVQLRGGRKTVEIPEGIVVLNGDLPNVHSLNLLILDAPLPGHLDAPALVALADRWLGHLSHRFVRIDDGEAGERLAPELLQAGWLRSRTAFMVFRGDPSAAGRDHCAREISDAELDAVMLANFEHHEHEPNPAPDLVPQLVQAQIAIRAGTTARRFGAGVDGGLQAMCTLFLEPDVVGMRMAMVEQVGTLPAYRERGLAKAVVSAAVGVAGDWGAKLIIVPADADDWPQLLYSKLGFEPVGIQVSFTLRGVADC